MVVCNVRASNSNCIAINIHLRFDPNMDIVLMKVKGFVQILILRGFPGMRDVCPTEQDYSVIAYPPSVEMKKPHELAREQQG